MTDAPIALNDEQPLHVTEPMFKISAEVEKMVREESFLNGTPTLGGGPYMDMPLNIERGYRAGQYHGHLYAMMGNVEPHTDGAGQTYGLVLVATGHHVLGVDSDAEDPACYERVLKPGCVFHIDSDKEHWTTTRYSSDLLIILTLDWGWRHEEQIPAMASYKEFAEKAYKALEKQARKIGDEMTEHPQANEMQILVDSILGELPAREPSDRCSVSSIPKGAYRACDPDMPDDLCQEAFDEGVERGMWEMGNKLSPMVEQIPEMVGTLTEIRSQIVERSKNKETLDDDPSILVKIDKILSCILPEDDKNQAEAA